MNRFDVSVYAIRRRPGRRRPFEVRWQAAGRSRSKSFITRKLADSYRAELVRAARMGLDFDPLTGEPAAWNLPQPAIVTWCRVTRRMNDDQSCRPVWLAMKTGAAAGQVEVLAPAPAADTPLGVRVIVHASFRGPRQAAAISETMIDGIIAAFHAGLGHGPLAAAVAEALAPRLPGMTTSNIQALVAGSVPGPLFTSPAFTVKGTYVQISPCDDRLQVGEVTIEPDAQGEFPQISGELFVLRPIAA